MQCGEDIPEYQDPEDWTPAVEAASHCPINIITMALPDDHVITGKSSAVFDYCGLNAEGIAEKAVRNLR